MTLAIFFGEKHYLMERFYREIRKKNGWLMDKGKPVGGKWNYDKENRKPLPADKEVPKPCLFSHDVSELFKIIEDAGVQTIGTIDPQKFYLADITNRVSKTPGFFSRYLPGRFWQVSGCSSS